MLTERPELRPIFQPLPEISFEINGMNINIAYSLEKMREDFITFGIMRGHKEELLRTIAGVLFFKEKSIPNRDDGTMQEDSRIVPQLDESLFIARYRYDLLREEIEEALNQTDIGFKPDVACRIVKEIFERNWRHEREHLYQEFEAPSHDFFEVVDVLKKTRVRRIIENVAWGIATKYTFLAYLRFLQIDLKGIDELLGDGIGLGVYYLLHRGDNFLNYKNDIYEIKAREEEIEATNLPGIFEVSAVPS